MLNVWFNHVQSLFLSPDGPNHRPIVQTGGLEQRGAERGRHRGGEGGHQLQLLHGWEAHQPRSGMAAMVPYGNGILHQQSWGIEPVWV